MTKPETLFEACRLALNLRWRNQNDGTKTYQRAERVAELIGAERPCVAATAREVEKARRALAGRGLAPSTVNRYMAAFRGALSAARDAGWIEEVPTFCWSKEPPPRERVLSDAEEIALLEALEDDPPHRALVVFLLDVGCRVSEALRLRWANVELTETTGRQSRVTFRDTKNGSSRTVPLTERARYACQLRHTQGPFFGQTVHTLRHAFDQAKSRAGLEPGLSPHALRHTCATRLVSRGVSLPVVQRWLGHKDIQTTMRYEHADMSALERAVEVL